MGKKKDEPKIKVSRVHKDDPVLLGFTAVVDDAFGLADASVETCPHCGKEDQLVVGYRKRPDLGAGIDPDDKKIVLVFVSHIDRYCIGFTCGCYGKFHRQVAHIKDRMKR